MADIVRRRPSSLRRRWGWPLERLFEDLFEGFEGEWPEEWRERFSPVMDVTETEDEVTLTAEVPGIEKDDIEVTVDDGVLTLRGEKREEEEHEGEQLHRVERRFGRFERSIRLPRYVDSEHIDAEYKNGVLTLHMPKTEESKARQIQVK